MINNGLQKAGNGVVLSGNTQKAAGYIRIAQRRLADLKYMMVLANSNMIKKYYSYDAGCVSMIIQSVAGMDRIFIQACERGKCRVTLTTEDLGSNKVRLTIKYTFGGTPGTGWASLIKWGDEFESFHSSIKGVEEVQEYTYADGGEKTIEVKAWNTKQLKSGGSPSSPATTTGYSKIGEDLDSIDYPNGDDAASHAEAWALPWTETTATTYPNTPPTFSQGIRRNAYSSKGRATFPRWEMSKTTLAINLEGEGTGKMIGLIGWKASGIDNIFSDDPVRPAILRNGEKLYTIHDDTVHERNSAIFFHKREIENLSELTELSFEADNGYAYPSGHVPGTSGFQRGTEYYRQTWDGFTASFYPYDCIDEANITFTLE